MVYKSSINQSGGGVSSINGLGGNVTITSTGGTIDVTTPDSETINVEVSYSIISGYVPYTGAIQNVDLGPTNIISALAFYYSDPVYNTSGLAFDGIDGGNIRTIITGTGGIGFANSDAGGGGLTEIGDVSGQGNNGTRISIDDSSSGRTISMQADNRITAHGLSNYDLIFDLNPANYRFGIGDLLNSQFNTSIIIQDDYQQIYLNALAGVGVNNPTPLAPLAVIGTIMSGNGDRTVTDPNDVAYFEKSSSEYVQFHMYGGTCEGYVSINPDGNGSMGGGGNSVDPGMQVWTADSTPLRLGTDRTEQLNIYANGNICAAPDSGNFYIGGNGGMGNVDPSGTGANFIIGKPDGLNYAVMQSASDSGTTAWELLAGSMPSAGGDLYTTVYGSTATGATIFGVPLAGGSAIIGQLQGHVGPMVIGNYGTGSLTLGQNNNAYLTLQSNLIAVNGGINFTSSTGTGTKIGTATNQKWGFWNATPIVQPVNTVAIDTLLTNTGLRASGGVANFDTDIKAAVVGKTLFIKQGTNGMSGRATLVAGIIAVTISGLTSSDDAQVTRRVSAGTLGTGGFIAVCTTNTLTITSINTAGATSILDTSTFFYTIIRPA